MLKGAKERPTVGRPDGLRCPTGEGEHVWSAVGQGNKVTERSLLFV